MPEEHKSTDFKPRVVRAILFCDNMFTPDVVDHRRAVIKSILEALESSDSPETFGAQVQKKVFHFRKEVVEVDALSWIAVLGSKFDNLEEVIAYSRELASLIFQHLSPRNALPVITTGVTSAILVWLASKHVPTGLWAHEVGTVFSGVNKRLIDVMNYAVLQAAEHKDFADTSDVRGLLPFEHCVFVATWAHVAMSNADEIKSFALSRSASEASLILAISSARFGWPKDED